MSGTYFQIPLPVRWLAVKIGIGRSAIDGFFSRMSVPANHRYTTREEVMFFDTDIGGVVHNIAYLRMIETCRTKLAGLMGMDLRGMSETKLFPVVVRTEIDYRRPATLGDALLIHGRLDEIQRARFWCAFEVRRESDDALLITCRQCLALVQMPEGRPVRLPAEWSLGEA